MTRHTHHESCHRGFAGDPAASCLTCAALDRAEAVWNECSAMTERLAFERGKELAVKAMTDEAIRLGISARDAALLIAAGKGAQ